MDLCCFTARISPDPRGGGGYRSACRRGGSATFDVGGQLSLPRSGSTGPRGRRGAWTTPAMSPRSGWGFITSCGVPSSRRPRPALELRPESLDRIPRRGADNASSHRRQGHNRSSRAGIGIRKPAICEPPAGPTARRPPVAASPISGLARALMADEHRRARRPPLHPGLPVVADSERHIVDPIPSCRPGGRLSITIVFPVTCRPISTSFTPTVTTATAVASKLSPNAEWG